MLLLLMTLEKYQDGEDSKGKMVALYRVSRKWIKYYLCLELMPAFESGDRQADRHKLFASKKCFE
jgi:hypothetical protein